MPDDELKLYEQVETALALEEKAVVQTQAGAAKYGQSVGSTIQKDEVLKKPDQPLGKTDAGRQVEKALLDELNALGLPKSKLKDVRKIVQGAVSDMDHEGGRSNSRSYVSGKIDDAKKKLGKLAPKGPARGSGPPVQVLGDLRRTAIEATQRTGTAKPTPPPAPSTTTTTGRRAPAPATPSIPGLLTPGNISAYDRQGIRNRVTLLTAPGRVTVAPAVGPDGQTISDADAAKRFQRTGQHLGIFKDKASATAYARTLPTSRSSTPTKDQVESILNGYGSGGRLTKTDVETLHRYYSESQDNDKTRMTRIVALLMDTPESLGGYSRTKSLVEDSELETIADGLESKVSSRAYPGLDRSPKKNWVDNAGGLPSYIERIAKHLHYERGMTIGHAIATAVNRVKKWASGVGEVNPDTRAKAAKAVAEWEAMKAKSRAKTAAKNVTKALDGDEAMEEKLFGRFLNLMAGPDNKDRPKIPWNDLLHPRGEGGKFATHVGGGGEVDDKIGEHVASMRRDVDKLHGELSAMNRTRHRDVTAPPDAARAEATMAAASSHLTAGLEALHAGNAPVFHNHVAMARQAMESLGKGPEPDHTDYIRRLVADLRGLDAALSRVLPVQARPPTRISLTSPSNLAMAARGRARTDRIMALAGKTLETKGPRRVRTPEGSRFYNLPVGSVIVPGTRMPGVIEARSEVGAVSQMSRDERARAAERLSAVGDVVGAHVVAPERLDDPVASPEVAAARLANTDKFFLEPSDPVQRQVADMVDKAYGLIAVSESDPEWTTYHDVDEALDLLHDAEVPPHLQPLLDKAIEETRALRDDIEVDPGPPEEQSWGSYDDALPDWGAGPVGHKRAMDAVDELYKAVYGFDGVGDDPANAPWHGPSPDAPSGGGLWNEDDTTTPEVDRHVGYDGATEEAVAHVSVTMDEVNDSLDNDTYVTATDRGDGTVELRSETLDDLAVVLDRLGYALMEDGSLDVSGTTISPYLDEGTDQPSGSGSSSFEAVSARLDALSEADATDIALGLRDDPDMVETIDQLMEDTPNATELLREMAADPDLVDVVSQALDDYQPYPPSGSDWHDPDAYTADVIEKATLTDDAPDSIANTAFMTIDDDVTSGKITSAEGDAAKDSITEWLDEQFGDLHLLVDNEDSTSAEEIVGEMIDDIASDASEFTSGPVSPNVIRDHAIARIDGAVADGQITPAKGNEMRQVLDAWHAEAMGPQAEVTELDLVAFAKAKKFAGSAAWSAEHPDAGTTLEPEEWGPAAHAKIDAAHADGTLTDDEAQLAHEVTDNLVEEAGYHLDNGPDEEEFHVAGDDETPDYKFDAQAAVNEYMGTTTPIKWTPLGYGAEEGTEYTGDLGSEDTWAELHIDLETGAAAVEVHQRNDDGTSQAVWEKELVPWPADVADVPPPVTFYNIDAEARAALADAMEAGEGDDEHDYLYNFLRQVVEPHVADDERFGEVQLNADEAGALRQYVQDLLDSDMLTPEDEERMRRALATLAPPETKDLVLGVYATIADLMDLELKARHVRTPEGAREFRRPIGSVIAPALTYPVAGGGRISLADAAARMYGRGSPQHLKAQKREVLEQRRLATRLRAERAGEYTPEARAALHSEIVRDRAARGRRRASLAGAGAKALRRVRTPEGARLFDLPIGAPIVARPPGMSLRDYATHTAPDRLTADDAEALDIVVAMGTPRVNTDDSLLAQEGVNRAHDGQSLLPEEVAAMRRAYDRALEGQGFGELTPQERDAAEAAFAKLEPPKPDAPSGGSHYRTTNPTPAESANARAVAAAELAKRGRTVDPKKWTSMASTMAGHGIAPSGDPKVFNPHWQVSAPVAQKPGSAALTAHLDFADTDTTYFYVTRDDDMDENPYWELEIPSPAPATPSQPSGGALDAETLKKINKRKAAVKFYAKKAGMSDADAKAKADRYEAHARAEARAGRPVPTNLPKTDWAAVEKSPGGSSAVAATVARLAKTSNPTDAGTDVEVTLANGLKLRGSISGYTGDQGGQGGSFSLNLRDPDGDLAGQRQVPYLGTTVTPVKKFGDDWSGLTGVHLFQQIEMRETALKDPKLSPAVRTKYESELASLSKEQASRAAKTPGAAAVPQPAAVAGPKFIGRSRSTGEGGPRERQVRLPNGTTAWAEEGSALYQQAEQASPPKKVPGGGAEPKSPVQSLVAELNATGGAVTPSIRTSFLARPPAERATLLEALRTLPVGGPGRPSADERDNMYKRFRALHAKAEQDAMHARHGVAPQYLAKVEKTGTDLQVGDVVAPAKFDPPGTKPKVVVSNDERPMSVGGRRVTFSDGTSQNFGVSYAGPGATRKVEVYTRAEPAPKGVTFATVGPENGLLVAETLKQDLADAGLDRRSTMGGGEMTGWTGSQGSIGFAVRPNYRLSADKQKIEAVPGQAVIHLVLTGDEKHGIKWDYDMTHYRPDDEYDDPENHKQPTNASVLNDRIRKLVEARGLKVREVRAGGGHPWDKDVEYEVVVDAPKLGAKALALGLQVKARHVRTAEGSRLFGLPIGSLIKPGMKPGGGKKPGVPDLKPGKPRGKVPSKVPAPAPAKAPAGPVRGALRDALAPAKPAQGLRRRRVVGGTSGAASPESLGKLRGHKVTVTDKAGKEIHGTVTDVSDRGVTLRTEDGKTTRVPLAAVTGADTHDDAVDQWGKPTALLQEREDRLAKDPEYKARFDRAYAFVSQPPKAPYDKLDPRSTNPEYDAYVDDLERRVAHAMADPGPVGQSPDGQLNANGIKLAKRLAKEELGRVEARRVPKDRRVIMAAGISGAGKTTVLKSQAGGASTGIEFEEVDGVSTPRNYAVANADDMKERMKPFLPPEYAELGLNPDETTSLVHEVSSDANKRYLAALVKDGYNTILDGTYEGRPEKRDGEVRMFKDNDYKVMGVLVDGDLETSMLRATARHTQPPRDADLHKVEPAPEGGYRGRYVPIGPVVVNEQAPDERRSAKEKSAWGTPEWKSANAQNFQTSIDAAHFDAWVVFDSNQQVVGQSKDQETTWTGVAPASPKEAQSAAAAATTAPAGPTTSGGQAAKPARGKRPAVGVAVPAKAPAGAGAA